MLELLEDGADKGENVELEEGRKGAKPVEKVSMGKGLNDIVAIYKFLPNFLLERIDEY